MWTWALWHMARARDWFQTQILLQPKRICYVFLNTDTGEELHCFYGRLTLLLMSFSELYWIVSLFCTFHLTLLLSTDLCARWYILFIPLTSTVLFNFSIKFFPYFSNSNLKVPCFSRNQPWFFLPISIFYPFFSLPFFLSSFSTLQNTTIYSLSSALDVFQSDFLCFHTDTILTSLANDKYISKNLPLLCLECLQKQSL